MMRVEQSMGDKKNIYILLHCITSIVKRHVKGLALILQRVREKFGIEIKNVRVCVCVGVWVWGCVYTQ